jgi:HEAT repeat protein
MPAAPWWNRGAAETASNPLLERAEAGESLTSEEQAQLARLVDGALDREPSGWRRSRLVLLLGPHPSPAIAPVLQKGLADPSAQVRIAACQALREQPAERAIASLAGVLSNDAELDVRLEAARSLSVFQQPQAVLALAAALDDSDPAVQFRVMQSLKACSGRELGNDLAEWKQFAASVMMQSGGSSISQAPAGPDVLRR